MPRTSRSLPTSCLGCSAESVGDLCRYPREIPELPWYRHTVPQLIMAGFLPFSAIYIEL